MEAERAHCAGVLGTSDCVSCERPLFAIGRDLAIEVGHHESAGVIDGQKWGPILISTAMV
jgi:hypothetical protein